MEIEFIIGLIKDTKCYVEIIEKASGASFGLYNCEYVPLDLLRKIAIEINVQYVDGKRLLIIKF